MQKWPSGEVTVPPDKVGNLVKWENLHTFAD